jgi:hypothetical protein
MSEDREKWIKENDEVDADAEENDVEAHALGGEYARHGGKDTERERHGGKDTERERHGGKDS